ncbi:MAG: InlB B-repeat-containing protein [Fibromonadales bacterium]|nr:InlB B-repeat-containing protein [Fibromonadales bacterium]
MPFSRLSILLVFFAFSFATAEIANCRDSDDDFEIFAKINDSTKVSLGCYEEVSTEDKIDIMYGDVLTLSVEPDDEAYTWTTLNGTILGRGSSFSPKFLISENPTEDVIETYKVLKKDGLTKTIEVIISPRTTFTVYFDVNTDEVPEIDPIEVMKDSLVKPPETETLIREGYKFGGWDFDFSTPIVEDTTIKAIWNIKAYLVYFDTDGGTPSIIPQVVSENEFAKEPIETITKAGYTFDGWNFRFTTPITKDTIVKAKWINLFVSDTIVFDNDGFYIDEALSGKHHRYFVFSPSICEIKDTINKVIKDTIKIYINVKEPDVVLKKEDGNPLHTKDGFHYETLLGFKNRPGLDTLIYEWFSKKDNSHIKSDTILIETPIPFDTIIGQKWNNVLFVKNNSKKFTDFEWFKNNKEVGNLQFYSAGSKSTNTLNPNDIYRVVMHTKNGIRISTCEGKPKEQPSKTPSTPTPTLKKQVLGINEKSLNKNSKVYNLNGKLTKETPAGVYIVKEE